MPTPSWELLLGQAGALVLLFTIANMLWGEHKKSDSDKDEAHKREITALNEQHSRELADKDRQIAFLNELRKEAVVDKKATEERISALTEASKEQTSVVRESVEITNLLLQQYDRDSNYSQQTSPRRRLRGQTS